MFYVLSGCNWFWTIKCFVWQLCLRDRLPCINGREKINHAEFQILDSCLEDVSIQFCVYYDRFIYSSRLRQRKREKEEEEEEEKSEEEDRGGGEKKD